MSTRTKTKNLQLRGRMYYLRCEVNRKPILRSLGTDNLSEARARAKAMLVELRAARFGVLDATTARPGYATIGELFGVYRAAAAAAGSPKAKTYQKYMTQLGNLLRTAGATSAASIEGLSTEALTRDAVKGYGAAVLAAAGENELKRIRAQHTVRSTVTQVRALFSKWALDEYREAGLKLPPTLAGFTDTPALRTKVVGSGQKYQAPPAGLVAATLEAAEALKPNDPKRAVWLLCYRLALRASEATAATWDWIREDDAGRRYMDITFREDFVPKWEVVRSVPLSPLDWQELQAFRTAGDAHLLPGGTKTGRYNLVVRVFSEWMRGLGWVAERYQHAAHELRALRGSEWFTALGPAVAQKWLGHTTVATTCKYYADYLGTPEQLAGNGYTTPAPAPRLRLAQSA